MGGNNYPAGGGREIEWRSGKGALVKAAWFRPELARVARHKHHEPASLALAFGRLLHFSRSVVVSSDRLTARQQVAWCVWLIPITVVLYGVANANCRIGQGDRDCITK